MQNCHYSVNFQDKLFLNYQKPVFVLKKGMPLNFSLSKKQKSLKQTNLFNTWLLFLLKILEFSHRSTFYCVTTRLDFKLLFNHLPKNVQGFSMKRYIFLCEKTIFEGNAIYQFRIILNRWC
jgi:hypothetical protein